MDSVTSRFDATDPANRNTGLDAAQEAISAQRCIVMPTDTVYGIAADAFSAQAVSTLLACKGRGRNMPPPVLIPSARTLDGLAIDVPASARALAEEFWPGALTLILHAQPSLTWDLGDTRGTVALRVPDDEIALELLSRTGPLAVSSANRTGQPAASTAEMAFEQLGESVDVYLEAGVRPVDGGQSLGSTIIDCTLKPPRVVRVGALSNEQLRVVVPELLDIDGVSNTASDSDDSSAATDSTEATDSTVDGSDSEVLDTSGQLGEEPERQAPAHNTEVNHTAIGATEISKTTGHNANS